MHARVKVILSILLSFPFVAFADASEDGKRVVCRRDDRELMRYRYGSDVVKPYVEELRTPAGVNVLRDSPSDHKHHHGLMFGVAVDGIDFWGERNLYGHQVGRRERVSVVSEGGSEQKPGQGFVSTVSDGCKQQLDWKSPKDSATLLEEMRQVQVARIGDGKPTLLTWQTRLSVPKGKASVKLTGAAYFGLGMRFVESMDKGGSFCNADGKAGVEGTNAVRSRWCAYSAKVDGKPVTVLMFDHPRNSRHPATWFTMEKPFAYLCATLNLEASPMVMEAGQPLLLRYGVALWDGKPETAEIEKVYQQWVDTPALDDGAIDTKPAN
jgi:hypothetical protein